jgi:hypothetical protein
MSESVFDRPWVPPQIMRHYGLQEKPRMAAGVERRAPIRPDWSEFRWVVRYPIGQGTAVTIAAFPRRGDAEEYARLMNGEAIAPDHVEPGYVVEEVES